jgi:hypothetical protein
MSEIPFHLHYTLSRGQRIVPHLRVWGTTSALLILSLFTFFVFAAVLNLSQSRVRDGIGFLVFASLVFIVARGLFIGIIDILTTRMREVDVLVEENAAGVLLRGQRWWLFLDGFVEIRKYRRDIWTLRHHNGSVLNIPTTQISEDQLSHIKAAMERGRTPEGVRAVIERGRQITQILNEKKRT